MHGQLLSHVWLSVTLWTLAHEGVSHYASLSAGFSRQEYWSGLPYPSPGDLSDPGTEPESPASPALAGRFFTTEPPGRPKMWYICAMEYFSTIKRNKIGSFVQMDLEFVIQTKVRKKTKMVY